MITIRVGLILIIVWSQWQISTVALLHELALVRKRLDYFYLAGVQRWFDVLLGSLLIFSLMLRLIEE